jgi:hypothetical protein
MPIGKTSLKTLNPDFAVVENLPGCLKLDYDIITRV